MKKIFILGFAAALFLGSCTNEKAEWAKTSTTAKDARISLNISNDDEMIVTRTVVNANNEEWFAKVDDGTMAAASGITGQSYTAASHTITVASHQSEDAAYTANSGAGAAYYEKAETVTLQKGTNTVSIECGKAKNSKLTIDWSGANGVTGLTMKSVTATQTEKSRNYSYTTTGSSAFFYAGTEIAYTINYTFNSENKTITGTISAPAAATEYKLTVSANSNGTITTLSISYDDEFTDGGTTTETIDAATGEKVTTTQS